jgi:hypothetical protein
MKSIKPQKTSADEPRASVEPQLETKIKTPQWKLDEIEDWCKKQLTRIVYK